MNENMYYNDKPINNYTVCNCNNVSYFEILDALDKHNQLDALLEAYEIVRSTTHCSTGCGGCYNKVLAIISDAMSSK